MTSIEDSFYQMVGKRIESGRCGIALCVEPEAENDKDQDWGGECEGCPVKDCKGEFDGRWRNKVNRHIRKWYRARTVEIKKLRHLENL
jgi:hypothetical protein